MSMSKGEIVKTITSVLRSDASVRAKLGTLSRELLTYVANTGDVDQVNRLVAGINSRLQRPLFEYFAAYLDWHNEADKMVFGKRLGKDAKTRGDITTARAEWLKSEANNFWTWEGGKGRGKADRKEQDYKARVTNAVKRALNPEVGKLTVADVLAAVIAGGISAASIVAEVNTLIGEIADAEKKAPAPVKKTA